MTQAAPINQSMMDKLRAARGEQAEQVEIVTGVVATVRPVYFRQLVELIETLNRVGQLQHVVEAIASERQDDQLVPLVGDLLTHAPEIADSFTDLIQPHCDLDLRELTVSEFAKVLVVACSLSMQMHGGWDTVGKRLGMGGSSAPPKVA